MLEQMRSNLNSLKQSPPWRNRVIGRPINAIFEGIGAPEPGEYLRWKKEIQTLETDIAEEEARQMINRS